MLDKAEQKRYSRQTILPEIGLAGQLKLKSAKVLVVGAGGLGCALLQYLTAAGLGEIGIIDDDFVDITNLHRQILYSINDVGQAKVMVAKAKLELLNPLVKVIALQKRLTGKNAIELLQDYDLIIDGSDNFETRYLVNDTCMVLNKTLVFGSIFKFEGQISVFNYLSGPNYRDIFPEPPGLDELPNCSDVGVLGILPGIVGLYMANEAIKIICGIGAILSGVLLTINVLDNTTNYFSITKNSQSLQIPSLAHHGKFEEIDWLTLNQWLETDQNNIELIDVRENYEYDEFNIGGANIPLYELKENLHKIPQNKRVVFICATGHRSKIAARLSTTLFDGLFYSLKHGMTIGL